MTRTSTSPQGPMITEWWRRTYPALARDLGFDPQADEAAAYHLERLIDEHGVKTLGLQALGLNDQVVVAGAADTLRADLERQGVTGEESLIVADGALTEVLRTHDHVDLVTSDLDGDPQTLLQVNEQGTPVAVHAHGDNLALLDRWLPRFTGPVVPTRQTPDGPERVLCPGGFADGDRAVLIAARLGARRIRLVGFDLHGPPGRHSPTDPERKRSKMRWSARILKEARDLGVPIEGSWVR